ncbi:MAG: hypothetical protein RLY93_02500 [Sumerlaeia bacterium]
MARFDLKDSDYSFNASLDPFLVLKRMGFTEQSIYQEGSIIRIHCPIHRDLVRKSLIIDIEEKTFKCQYSMCEAHEGGLLLELVAMYYDCEIAEVGKNLFGDEDKSTDLLFRGEMYINKGMHLEALPYLEQAAQLNERNEITLCKLAALYLELNRKDDAYREYMKAAESYAVRGELEKTLSIYNILIMLQPGAVKARKELSYLFARMGRPDASAEQLKWVVDFYVQYGQTKAAADAIKSLLELDPENPMAFLLSARINQETGKRVPAMQAYEKALRLFLAKEEVVHGRTAFDEAIAIAPGNPRLRELQTQLEALEDRLAAEAAAAGDRPSEPGQDFEGQLMDWLEESTDLDVPQSEFREAASNLNKEISRAPTDTVEIPPDDLRVAMCLDDMKNMTAQQIEAMRNQIFTMFTDVRKTYEDGLISEWEMRTIKDFYKSFCVAMDKYREESAV